MAVLRMKLSEVLEENRTLHNELKTIVVHEIIKEGDGITGVCKVEKYYILFFKG